MQPADARFDVSETHVKRLRVGIIGAAIAGPTFALQILSHPILKARYWPILYERAQDPNVLDADSDNPQHHHSAGAGIALFGNGLYPLFRLGLREDLKRAGRESTQLSLWKAGYDGTFERLGTANHSGWAEDLQTHLIAFQRGDLQSVLLNRYRELGGEIRYDHALQSLDSLPSVKVQAAFENGTTDELDLVVGADGAYSKVRKYILERRDPATADTRWLPDFFGVSGIYGISSETQYTQTSEHADPQTHGLWLQRGNLSSSPLPNGRLRWDLLVPEDYAPSGQESRKLTETLEDHVPTAAWERTILSGAYPREYTVSILKKHIHVYHPPAASIGALLQSAECIIHTPLRQRVWNDDEIQCENVALIGDASRTLLPTSGQGTGFAIEDATVLAAMLLKHAALDGANDSAIKVALQEYARSRVPRSKRMAQVAWYAGKLGMGETWYWRWLRDLSSRLASFGGKEQSDSWPFNARFDVE